MPAVRVRMRVVGTRWAVLPFLLGAGAALAAAPYECLIEPVQVVELRSPVEGLIDKVNVQRGDVVKRGQVLVELHSEVERSTVELARYRAQMGGRIAAARDRLDYARKKVARQRELHSQNFVAAQVRDEAETEMRLAESELREAIENQELSQREYRRAVELLNQRELHSPFNGVVIDRMLNPGDLAESGTGRKPVLTLAQIDPLRVEVVLPAQAYGRFKVGMVGEVSPDGYAGKFPATVTVIDPVLDAASGTFRLRLELPGRKGGPPGGVRCSVAFPQLKADAGDQAGLQATSTKRN